MTTPSLHSVVDPHFFFKSPFNSFHLHFPQYGRPLTFKWSYWLICPTHVLKQYAPTNEYHASAMMYLSTSILRPQWCTNQRVSCLPNDVPINEYPASPNDASINEYPASTNDVPINDYPASPMMYQSTIILPPQWCPYQRVSCLPNDVPTNEYPASPMMYLSTSILPPQWCTNQRVSCLPHQVTMNLTGVCLALQGLWQQ